MRDAKILIVEDDIIVAQSLERLLNRFGYRSVSTVSNGEDAIAKATELKQDLILIDIRLKGALDGIQTVERIRAQYYIPIIYLTAYSDEKTIQLAKLTEPFAYLTKPVNEPELLINIEIALYKAELDQRLRESEKRNKAILQTAMDGFCRLDLQGNLLEVNEGYCQMTGYREGELLAMSIADLDAIETAADTAARTEKILQQGRDRFESWQRRKDGSLFAVEVSVQYMPDEECMVAFLHDITERKKAEDLLRESENRFQNAMQATNDGLWDWDRMTGRSYFSPGCYRMLGYEHGEFPMTAQAWLDHIYPDDRARAFQINSDCMENRAPSFEAEIRMRTKQGGWKWIFARGSAVKRDAQGQALRMAGTYIDIDERKKIEEERFRLLSAIEQIDEGIIITDDQGVIQYVNIANELRSGFPREKMIGLNLFFPQTSSYDDRFFQEMWQTVSSGLTWRGRLAHKKQDGIFFDLATVITPIRDSAGRIINYVSVSRDVTRELQLEQQLLQSQKMEAIGTLAGGIAHDFNNILGGIIGFTEAALDATPKESPVYYFLQQTLKSADRATELVKQILSFSRKNRLERKPVALPQVVRDALKLLRASLPATIEIRSALQEQTGLVMSDATQMHQIIMNLCTNAAHAMESTGGVLEVGLSAVEIGPEDLRVYPDLHAGSYLRLLVSDTGSGIDPGIVGRIFEPFFTTKETGRGTGMGLSVVHGIVKSHGGAIAVESALGKGTTFQVLLPRLSGEVLEAAAAEAPLPRGSERILFVDDEQTLTEIAKNILEPLGYMIIAAHSGREALDLFGKAPERFDLVITDLTMPHMTGYELARNLVLVRPDIPIILSTGYSEQILEGQENRNIHAVLVKPISKKALAEAIRRVLDRTVCKQ